MALTTDVTPRIHLTPTQVLGDPQRLGRLKAALTEGVFPRTPDEASAAQAVDECLKICGGSADTLSELLQTMLLAKHTAFYWAIVHRDPTISGVPPLLKKLLGICHPRGLSLEVEKDILCACSVEYDSDLYCAIRPYITRVRRHEAYSESAVLTGEEDRPRITASTHPADNAGNGKTTIDFKIPRFLSRLLADGEVYFEVPVMVGWVWRVQARLHEGVDGPDEHPYWVLELSEILHKEATRWTMTLRIKDPEEKAPSLAVYHTYSTATQVTVGEVPTVVPVSTSHPEIKRLVWLRRNQYTSNPSGQLCGQFTLQLA